MAPSLVGANPAGPGRTVKLELVHQLVSQQGGCQLRPPTATSRSTPTVEALLSSPARLQPQQAREAGATPGPERPCLQANAALSGLDRKRAGMDPGRPLTADHHGDRPVASGSLPAVGFKAAGAMDSGRCPPCCLKGACRQSGRSAQARACFQTLAITSARAGLRRHSGEPVAVEADRPHKRSRAVGSNGGEGLQLMPAASQKRHFGK